MPELPEVETVRRGLQKLVVGYRIDEALQLHPRALKPESIAPLESLNGESGFFEQSLSAYGQEGEPCPRCGTPIKRIVFGARSSHFCPRCQRRK